MTAERARSVTAAQAVGFGDRPSRALKVLKWVPVHRGSLAGFVSIELSIGLRLFDLPVFTSGTSGPWVGLPRKPRLDRERRQRVDINGDLEFEPIAEWRDRRTSNAFSHAVLAELVRKHPGALTSEPASPPQKSQQTLDLEAAP